MASLGLDHPGDGLPLSGREARERWAGVDPLLFGAALMLIGVGFLLAMSTSPTLAARLDLKPFHYVSRQAGYAFPAIALMIGGALLSTRMARRVGVGVFMAMLAALLLLPFFGVERGGAIRWFSVGGTSFQPSEIIKPGIIMLCGWMMSIKPEPGAPPGMTLAALILAVTVGLLARQPDYGQSALILACWGAMFFLSGASMMWAASGGLLLAAGAGMAYAASSHFRGRIDRFMNPDAELSTQMEMTLSAIGKGGFWGKGPGEGLYKLYLPDAHSDFVIAVAAEEYGLLLVLIIMALFLFIALRGLARSAKAPDAFTRIAGGGLSCLFGFQAAIHCGVAAHMLPTKGMTLPFVSYGGSSMIACGLAMGLLLALTRKRPDAGLQTMIGKDAA